MVEEISLLLVVFGVMVIGNRFELLVKTRLHIKLKLFKV